jgi:hypothetical protein
VMTSAARRCVARTPWLSAVIQHGIKASAALSPRND